MNHHAISLILEDHTETRNAFEQYRRLPKSAHEEKKWLSDEICSELLKHAAIENEIFIPGIRRAMEESGQTDEMTLAHEDFSDLIKEIEDMPAENELFDEKMELLLRLAENHMQEEEKGILMQSKRLNIDFDALGQEILRMKEEIEEVDMWTR